MNDDMPAALDDLRRDVVPALTRAFYAAQYDEDQTNPAADALAEDAAQVLRALADTARPDLLALGLDPEDREGLRWAEQSPPLAFYLACHEAVATFRYWAAYDDHGAALDAVDLAMGKWLHGQAPEPMRDTVRVTLGELDQQAREAKARAAKAEMAQRRQMSGVTRRVSDAKARARAAWAVFGMDGPSGPSLLARLKKATDAQLVALAEVYGCADGDALLLAATDKGSAIRKQMQRDNRR